MSGGSGLHPLIHAVIVLATAASCRSRIETPLLPADLAGVGPRRDLAAPLRDAAVEEIDLAERDADVPIDPPGKELTGEHCQKNTDCANGNGVNQKAVCIKVTGQPPNQITWDKGYCSTPCRIAKTDPQTGLNFDCPSDNATCTDSGGGTGECRYACLISPDCRDTYACFFLGPTLGCLPRTISECDPAQARSCPQNPPQTCLNAGDGTVGTCVGSCDPFKNTGCMMMDPACHASDLTGEGLCTGDNQSGAMAGSACGNYYIDCPGGYGCARTDRKCWKQCNKNNVAQQCSQGAACTAYTKTVNGMQVPVDANGTGICTKSP